MPDIYRAVILNRASRSFFASGAAENLLLPQTVTGFDPGVLAASGSIIAAWIPMDPSQLMDFEPLIGFQIAFAAKPVFHGQVETVERDAMAGFEQSVGGGKRVIEDRVVGKVAHGKVVDPADGAWVRGS
jgi:hypothetical protein